MGVFLFPDVGGHSLEVLLRKCSMHLFTIGIKDLLKNILFSTILKSLKLKAQKGFVHYIRQPQKEKN